MNHVETGAAQPNIIVVPSGGGGGGFAGRLVGAIIASCLISAIGYLGVYTTLFARAWLRKEGATVEMPAERKGKAHIVERGRNLFGSTIGKLKEQLAKGKEAATGGFEKAKEAGAKIGKKVEHTVDKKAEQLKQLLAHHQEEAKKKAEEHAKQLAIDKQKYDEAVAKFRQDYDSTCPNPRCHAPLRTGSWPGYRIVTCVALPTPVQGQHGTGAGPAQPPAVPARQPFPARTVVRTGLKRPMGLCRCSSVPVLHVRQAGFQHDHQERGVNMGLYQKWLMSNPTGWIAAVALTCSVAAGLFVGIAQLRCTLLEEDVARLKGRLIETAESLKEEQETNHKAVLGVVNQAVKRLAARQEDAREGEQQPPVAAALAAEPENAPAAEEPANEPAKGPE